jgi:hypothetical protein
MCDIYLHSAICHSVVIKHMDVVEYLWPVSAACYYSPHNLGLKVVCLIIIFFDSSIQMICFVAGFFLKVITEPRRNVEAPASLSDNVPTILVHHPADRVARIILLPTAEVPQNIFWFLPPHLQPTSPFVSVAGNKKVEVTDSIISQSLVCVSIPLCVPSFSSNLLDDLTLLNTTRKEAPCCMCL